MTKVRESLDRIGAVLARRPDLAERTASFFNGELPEMEAKEESMEEVMTLKEAAVVLKVSFETVAREIRRGNLQARKAGKAWRITKEGIDRYLRGERPAPREAIEDGQGSRGKAPSLNATGEAPRVSPPKQGRPENRLMVAWLALASRILGELVLREADGLVRVGSVLALLGDEGGLDQGESIAVLRRLEALGEVELRPHNDRERAKAKGLLGIEDRDRGLLAYIVLSEAR
jgi:excisionase family DNA binding protein